MTMAHVIAAHARPTLVLSHNKTLAAQLYGELKAFFPRNAVEFFISYYDYYQPEAYVPQTDTYIEKDSSINDDIDALRLRATSSLMERDDVVIVASVSAIYGLGDPEAYRRLLRDGRRGGGARAATRSSRTWCGSISAQRRRVRAGHVPRARATPSRSSRPTMSRASGSSCGATRSSGSPRSIRSTGNAIAQLNRAVRLPGHALRHRATRRSSARSRRSGRS